jgi:hypothetical protein
LASRTTNAGCQTFNLDQCAPTISAATHREDGSLEAASNIEPRRRPRWGKLRLRKTTTYPLIGTTRPWGFHSPLDLTVESARRHLRDAGVCERGQDEERGGRAHKNVFSGR